MDQGFWNDTYSYGGWDWGRPVLWIVFSTRADTCVSTAKRAHMHDAKEDSTHTHTHTLQSGERSSKLQHRHQQTYIIACLDF